MIKFDIAGYGKIGQLRHKILLNRDDVVVNGIYDVKMPKGEWH